MTRILSTTTLLITLFAIASLSNAFAPSSQIQYKTSTSSSSRINMGFGQPDEDVKPLTRENEPEEYFATDMDKMTDAEKIPVAIGGLLFISLPFVAGMIALYASK
jgi:hypothetical protein|eukprot:1059142_1